MQAASKKLYAKFPEPHRTANFRGSFVEPFLQCARMIQRKSKELLSVTWSLLNFSLGFFLIVESRTLSLKKSCDPVPDADPVTHLSCTKI